MTYAHPAVAAPSAPALPTIPVKEIAPFLMFGGLLIVIAFYFIGVEQGAFSLVGGTYLHEFVHDGRHLLGFPCH
jgi:hypothetical protein